jgi:regulator of protease activity HflC (stomatin/prohibitin superfamily)
MGCCTSVPNDKMAVVTFCGKFDSVSQPGFLCLPIPGCYQVAGYVSIRLQEVVVSCETKTRDNVFVNLQVAVQYEILKDRVYEAFYRLQNPHMQISAYIFDVVRSTVPRLLLDEVFESKDDIAMDVKQELVKTMGEFGYMIHQALVIDVSPNGRVRDAMNEINASKRLRQAATEKAEAEKLLVVKKAEADAESMHLQGVGMARRREAIMKGLNTSVDIFQTSVKGSTAKDVLELVLITQYYDVVRGLAETGGMKAVFTQDNDPMRNSMMQAAKV